VRRLRAELCRRGIGNLLLGAALYPFVLIKSREKKRVHLVHELAWFCHSSRMPNHVGGWNNNKKKLNKFDSHDLTTCKTFHVVKIQSAVAKKKKKPKKCKQAKGYFFFGTNNVYGVRVLKLPFFFDASTAKNVNFSRISKKQRL
jgi:hypothetical protein